MSNLVETLNPHEMKRLHKRLEKQIMATPTGELRELLCDLNIIMSEFIERLEKKRKR